MKFAEIEKIYTEAVNRYLADGFILNLNTMSGSQGEWGKIDLKKDGRLIRIRLESGYYHGDEVVSLIVGECHDERVLKVIGKPIGYQTVWNNDLVVLEKMEWYRIARWGDWFGTEKELCENKEKQYARMRAADVTDIVWESEGEKEKTAAYRIVRKKAGYRGIKKSDVVCVRHRVYEGKSAIEVEVRREKAAGRYSEAVRIS